MIKEKYINTLTYVLTVIALVACIGIYLYNKFTPETLVVPEYVEKVFDKDSVMEINIEISEENLNDLMENAIEEQYVPANITINDKTIENVGIRAKGNSSLQQVVSSESDRYSFKINFSEYITDQNLYGLEKMVLNNMISDSTYLKEYMSYEMMEFLDVNTPAYAFANIKINNEDWGLYLAIETLEEDFLERYYGKDYGNLYKPESNEMGGGGGGGQRPENENGQKGLEPPNMENGGKPTDELPNEDTSQQPINEASNIKNSQQATIQLLNSQTDQNLTSEQPTGEPPNMENGEKPTGEPPNMENGEKPTGERPNMENGEKPTGERPNMENGEKPTEETTNVETSDKSTEETTNVEISDKSTEETTNVETSENPTEETTSQNNSQQMQNRMGMGGGQNNKETALLYIDDNISSYSKIFDSVVTKGLTDTDKYNYIKMVKALNEGQDLEKYIDVDEVLRYFAVNTFLVNLDSYAGSMKHNYYLYEKDGVFQILPWDFNLSFGTFQMNNSQQVINFPIDKPVTDTMENSPLIAKLLEVEEYKEIYHSYLNQLVENYVNNGTYENRINTLNNLIYDYVKNDKTAFYTIDQYEEGIENLLIYGPDRAESITLQLQGLQPSEEYGNLETDFNVSALGGSGGNGGNKDMGNKPTFNMDNQDSNNTQFNRDNFNNTNQDKSFAMGNMNDDKFMMKNMPNTQNKISTKTIVQIVVYIVILVLSLVYALLYKRKKFKV